MKILFSVGSFGFLRNFEPALRRIEHAMQLVPAARRFVDAIEQQVARPAPAP